MNEVAVEARFPQNGNLKKNKPDGGTGHEETQGNGELVGQLGGPTAPLDG